MSQGDTAQKQWFEKMPGAYRRERNSLISEVFWRDRGHWETPPGTEELEGTLPLCCPQHQCSAICRNQAAPTFTTQLMHTEPHPTPPCSSGSGPCNQACRSPSKTGILPQKKAANLANTLCPMLYRSAFSNPAVGPRHDGRFRSPEDQSANLTKTGCPVPVEVTSLPPLICSWRSPSKPGPQAWQCANSPDRRQHHSKVTLATKERDL